MTRSTAKVRHIRGEKTIINNKYGKCTAFQSKTSDLPQTYRTKVRQKYGISMLKEQLLTKSTANVRHFKVKRATCRKDAV